MIVEEKFRIERPLAEVWDFFLDIPRVSQCVPGAENVHEVGEDRYGGSLSVRVGPIAANFQGEVTILEATPPSRLVASVEGKDRRTSSFIKGTFTAGLQEVQGATEVSYQVDVAIRGRLGQFGSTVVQATAKELTLAFVDCVRKKLVSSASQAGAEMEHEVETGAPATAGTQQVSVLAIAFRTIRRLLGDLWQRLRPQSS